MPTRDEILSDLLVRVTALENKVKVLETKRPDPWQDEFVPATDEFTTTDDHVPAPLAPATGPQHPDDPTEDTPEVIEARKRIAEANATDKQPNLHVQEVQVTPGTDEVTIQVPSPTNEQLALRHQVAELLLANLNGLDPEVAYEAYLEGGPIWLHAFNRDHVISLPDDLKRAMVEDCSITAPETAHELARDLLKVTDPDAQSSWAHDNMETVSDQGAGGVPLDA